jgi:xylulose-5-phosphate/fructose-6-phosphate phosphoketolase
MSLAVADLKVSTSTTDSEELRRIDAYWRAANYLTVGQLYLRDNPLLSEPLTTEHVKRLLLGHWGTTPGLNFIYAHLNRLITRHDVNAICIAGTGHGGQAILANAWLEGTYTELFRDVTRDEEGMRRLFRQFTFPDGVPSHAGPNTPGAIQAGGELGYVLAHAFGAAFDNPDLIVAAIVGDGEAETGPLAASWQSNKFLNPASDGAVLPIVHLNGYKISNPTLLARMPDGEIAKLFSGVGYETHFAGGDDPMPMHAAMARAFDVALAGIRSIQQRARDGAWQGFEKDPPRWPVIVLRTPKGWTGPREVDGKQIEDTWRSHHLPIENPSTPEHLRQLESWMKSYRPHELFDRDGAPSPDVAALVPHGNRRLGANPHANGGVLLRDLELPDFRHYAVALSAPGSVKAAPTETMGRFLRDAIRANNRWSNFRIMAPDEIETNRLEATLESTSKVSMQKILPTDEHMNRAGRVMEVLSEHVCQGWLEGYLLSGRHGLFSSYEGFAHVIDSMFNQHAKWLELSRGISWRRPVAALNYLLTSHVWHQNRNGLTHQNPGFIGHVLNKKPGIANVFLPPDANTLLAVTDRCLRSRDTINVIVAGNQAAPQWLDIESAAAHADAGIAIWDWASNDQGGEPDLVMACAGDVPTMEALAAVSYLRRHSPNLRIRFVNVLELARLQPLTDNPRGLSDEDYDAIFTCDRPIAFIFHGYASLIHSLTYKRTNRRLSVRGFMEEGDVTTPFDMTVKNHIDRFHVAEMALALAAGAKNIGAEIRQDLRARLLEHRRYVTSAGEDLPEVRDWKWT